jgi:aminopeptidase N
MPADAISTDTTPQEIRLADYAPPAFLIDTVDLRFELDESATKVTSRLALRRNPAAPSKAPLHLDGEALTLVGITRDGASLGPGNYQQTSHGLTISDMPDACVLEIETRISPKDNTDFTGLYVSGGNYFTQCEAQGFRRMTYFPDRPDVMSRYTTTIIGSCPVMLSNGNPGPM